jgi:invasion protein IalB
MSNELKLKRAAPWLAAILGVGLAAAPAPLAAQSEAPQSAVEFETQQFEDWVLRCQPESETQPRACRIRQNIVAEDSGNTVLQIVAGRFGQEKILGAVFFVPVGVRLPPGIRIQVDERPPRTFPFEVCDSETCQVRAILEGDLLEDFKAGVEGQVKYQNSAGQSRTVPISLKGFTAALGALP